MRLFFCAGLLFTVALVINAPILLGQAVCHPFQPQEVTALFAYCRSHFHLNANVALSIIKNDVINSACYRQVTISSTQQTAPLVLFVSPDHRFVSASLVDLKGAPSDWERADASRTNAILTAEYSAAEGRVNAPLTVVEFADFECPFCRTLNEWFHALPVDLTSRIRIVYKHLPLPSHPWARAASAAAICSEKQSPASFWALRDFLFRSQTDLTVDSLRRRVASQGSVLGINVRELFSCVDNGEADTIIERDFLLARYLRVTGTPTLFINGVRLSPIMAQSQLQEQITKTLESGPLVQGSANSESALSNAPNPSTKVRSQ